MTSITHNCVVVDITFFPSEYINSERGKNNFVDSKPTESPIQTTHLVYSFSASSLSFCSEPCIGKFSVHIAFVICFIFHNLIAFRMWILYPLYYIGRLVEFESIANKQCSSSLSSFNNCMHMHAISKLCRSFTLPTQNTIKSHLFLSSFYWFDFGCDFYSHVFSVFMFFF